jgi:hypothetical protein
VIGDVNNDGWPDIIVTSNCQPKTCVDGSIRLLLNNQDGTFTLTPTAIAPSMGGPLAIGDLNGDGNLDLVADIGVLLGNGDGTFTQDTSVTLPGGTISIALADVNNDGFLGDRGGPSLSQGASRRRGRKPGVACCLQIRW